MVAANVQEKMPLNRENRLTSLTPKSREKARDEVVAIVVTYSRLKI